MARRSAASAVARTFSIRIRALRIFFSKVSRRSLARRRPVLVDEEGANRLGALGRVAVSFGGLDDRAFHQDVPGEGKADGIAETGLFGELAHDRADVLEVDGARGTDGVLEVGGLEQNVDERAALEVVLAEPLVEGVEDREQSLFGGGAAAPGLGFDPLARPELLAPLQESEHKVVLGREMAVERRLRDARAVDQLVDTHRTDPAAREEVVRGGQNPLSGPGRPAIRCERLRHRLKRTNTERQNCLYNEGGGFNLGPPHKGGYKMAATETVARLGAHAPATTRSTQDETKLSLKTTEFWAMAALIVAILIAAAVSDSLGDVRAWTLVTAVGIGYMISRGLAKSGTKHVGSDDPLSGSNR